MCLSYKVRTWHFQRLINLFSYFSRSAKLPLAITVKEIECNKNLFFYHVSMLSAAKCKTFQRLLIVIIRLMLSILVWPKVISLRGFYCNSTKRGYQKLYSGDDGTHIKKIRLSISRSETIDLL